MYVRVFTVCTYSLRSVKLPIKAGIMIFMTKRFHICYICITFISNYVSIHHALYVGESNQQVLHVTDKSHTHFSNQYNGGY